MFLLMVVLAAPCGNARADAGNADSGTFPLYLGPNFVAIVGAGGVGAADSAPFALYLVPFSEGFALSAPFELDTNVATAISGVVRSGDGTAVVSAATVELYLGSSLVQATTSDGSGRFAFYQDSPGDFVVRAAKSGYGMATSDLLRYQGSGTLTADLALPVLSIVQLPDLSLRSTDLTYTVLNSGALTLTAMVHNNGGAAAANVRLRFYDASIGSGIGSYTAIEPDVIIPSVAVGAAAPASVTWTPLSGYQRFYVFADPLGAITETSEINNVGLRDLGALGRMPPRVSSVAAKFDGLDDPRLLGRFLAGVEGADNTFTVVVSDPDDDVSSVRFDFDGVVVEDDSPAGGWAVGFDTGQLAGGNRPLRVTAYDRAGLASEPLLATLVVEEWPAWAKGHVQVEQGFPIGFGMKPGYFTFTFRVLNREHQGESVLFFEDIVDPNVLVVGSTHSRIALDVFLGLSFPLSPGLPWLVEGKVRYANSVFGQPQALTETHVEGTISTDGSILESINITFTHERVLYRSPEVSSPPLFISGVRVEVGLGMDVMLRALLEANFATNFSDYDLRFLPQVGARINGVLRVSDPVKFARLELILSPRLLLGPDIRYEYPPGQMTLDGTFSADIRGRIVGSIIWGVVSHTLRTFGWGPWDWSYPRDAEAIALPAMVALETDSLHVPEIFPYPNAAASPGGELGVVWCADVDPDLARSDPEVFFALRPVGSAWGAAERVTTNARFETVPCLGWAGDGRAVAVWVENSLLESEVTSTMSLSTILDHQDLWSAVRDSSGWSDPVAVAEETGGPLRADGLPAVCGLPDGAMLAWARATGDSALAPGSGEIFWSRLVGNSWSAPLRLTDDASDDTGPALCRAVGDDAVVAWLREEPAGSGMHKLLWAAWDGAAWSPERLLRDSAWRKQAPSLAARSDGGNLATWIEIEARSDSSLIYHLFGATRAAPDSVWSPAEEVAADSLFMETPTALVDLRNIAVVTWRGHDGYDGDLKVALKDLDTPASGWTAPRTVAADTLTDWMATAVLDGDNNLNLVDLKTDLEGEAIAANFLGGLSLASKGIANDLKLEDSLNFGFRPLSCDLRLAEGALTLGVANPAVGDTVTVTARVENIGDIASAPAALRFFIGHPDSGGTPLAPDDIPLAAIAPDSASLAVADWVVTAGAHELWAVVDPDGDLPEQNEGNNLSGLAVAVRPDPALVSLVLASENPAPGDSVIVTAIVRNAGGADAIGYRLTLAHGPGAFGDFYPLDLAVGSLDTLTVSFLALAGLDTIVAVLDADSLIQDQDRANNSARAVLRTLPDLVVEEGSVLYEPNVGTGLISAAVVNLGGVPSGLFLTRFYDGNPMAGGLLLGQVEVPGLAARDSTTVSMPWQAGIGLHTVYVQIDEPGTIAERDDGNNGCFQDVIRSTLPDLVAIPGSIIVQFAGPDSASLSVRVANSGSAHAMAVGVEFFSGDPDSGGALISGRLLLTLSPGDTTLVEAPWARADSLAYEIHVLVDRALAIAEDSETNNRTLRLVPVTGVGDEPPNVPVALALYGGHPNPFNAHTTIRYDLPRAGVVHLALFDLRGRRVRQLLSGEMPPGFHAVEWDGCDDEGQVVASGVYFCRLDSGMGRETRKLTFVK
jgi:subtilase family serine protease